MELVAAVVVGLAAWRLTALLSYERGPLDICLRARSVLGFQHDDRGEPLSWPNSPLHNAIACPLCLGIWCAIATYFVWLVEERIVIVGAAAAVAAVERWVRVS